MGQSLPREVARETVDCNDGDERGRQSAYPSDAPVPKIVDRLATGLIYQGTRPNVSTNDYCGEGYCKQKMQQSIDRGMFYAWAEKIGTLYMACNYEPCWTQAKDKHQVLGAGAW